MVRRMENILNKNIFKDGDLNKLSPDYTPHNLVLRMQLRRSLVKDAHNHIRVRNNTWTRKSIKKTKESCNINKEIVRLRHDFNNTNLKNRLTLKTLQSLKNKSEANDDKLTLADNIIEQLNEVEDDISLPEFPDGNDLEIRNDNEFKLNTKTKPLKQNKSNKLPSKNNKEKHAKDNLLDLNKDINENNEDLFRVSCIHKIENHQENLENKELVNISESKETSFTPRPVSELQKLLVMMALTSKTTQNDEQEEYDKFYNERSPTNENHYDNIAKDFVFNSDESNVSGIIDILSITSFKVKIGIKEKYIMEKYVLKWKNYVSKRKTYLEEQRQATLSNFFDKIAKKKLQATQSKEHETKAKLIDYNTYQHRYKMQKHIIALQKAKLDEQSRVIEELKYNKILEATRQSVDDMKEEVRKTYYEMDRKLKPKIKCLTKELKIPDIEEPSLILHCLKMPQFLQRMEKRARDREEKHAMIRERRRQMEEERIKIKQQAEIAKAEMDKEEKSRRINELKEKRKRERIENIRKKQWAARLRGLIVMADLHYEKTLMSKYGIAPLRLQLQMKRDNIEKAEAHYIFQLKNNIFLHWMWYTEDMWFERNFKAEDFYRKTLLRKGFMAFKLIYYNVILKNQVADDYYDLYITQLGFRMFSKGIKVLRKEQEAKWKKAVVYHKSNLLFKAFTCWSTLPALNELKREQDCRKARWRKKVLQVVPDYKPPED